MIKKAERQRIDAFELWCWRRFLKVPWNARRSNQSILEEISSEYSLEGLILKLKLQYFCHLMQRTDSLGKILMLGKIEDGSRRGWQRMRWLDGIIESGHMRLSNSWSWWWTGRPGVLQSMESQRVGHNWVTELNWPDAGKVWRWEEKGMTEDEMVGLHHQLDGHKFKWGPGFVDGQGSLACCSPWGRKELDTTEQLNWTDSYRVSYNLQMTDLPLPFNLDISYFFFCLNVLARISNTMLNRSGRVGILVLFHSLVGRLSAFHHWVLC